MKTDENEKAIGVAVICGPDGSPVHVSLNEEDKNAIAHMQDAEEEPMLRDAA